MCVLSFRWLVFRLYPVVQNLFLRVNPVVLLVGSSFVSCRSVGWFFVCIMSFISQLKIIGVVQPISSARYCRYAGESPAKYPLYGRDKAAEWAGTAVFGLYIHLYI